jgi:hypothetical protein
MACPQPSVLDDVIVVDLSSRRGVSVLVEMSSWSK